VETFYEALCADYQTEIAEKEVSRMEERLALAGKLKEAGRATDADVSTAEYHLEDAKRLLLDARHSARDAREALGILLGRSGPVREQLDDKGPNPLGRAGVLLSGSAEGAAKSSLRLAALREEAAATEASACARRSSWIPTVSVSARYGYDSEDAFDFDSDRDSYVVGLIVSWNAFDGGGRESRIREAQDLKRASAARLKEGEKEVRRAVRAAVRRCAAADARDRTAKKKVASYLARYRAKAKGHEAGRVSFEDLLEAQSELAQARLEGARAYCETRSARARLIEVTGSW
jgi:outer membrane protein TolC